MVSRALTLWLFFLISAQALGSSSDAHLHPANPRQEQIQLHVRNYFSQLGIHGDPSSSSGEIELMRQRSVDFRKRLQTAPPSDQLFYVQSLIHTGMRVWLKNGNTIAPAPGEVAQNMIRILSVLHQNGRVQFRVGPHRRTFNGKARVLGHYHCSSSVMSIDLDAGPADTLAVLVHELNHFFGDRDGAGPRMHLSSVVEDVIVEESLTTLLGAVFLNHLLSQSKNPNLIHEIAKHGIDFTLADLSPRSISGRVLRELQTSAEPAPAVFKNLMNNHSNLAARLIKSQREFYFPGLRAFDMPYILVTDRYLPILGLLSSPTLFAMDAVDFTDHLKVDQGLSFRCKGFHDAAVLLKKVGYPGLQFADGSATGGESGKTGGESGKTAGSQGFPCLSNQRRSP